MARPTRQHGCTEPPVLRHHKERWPPKMSTPNPVVGHLCTVKDFDWHVGFYTLPRKMKKLTDTHTTAISIPEDDASDGGCAKTADTKRLFPSFTDTLCGSRTSDKPWLMNDGMNLNWCQPPQQKHSSLPPCVSWSSWMKSVEVVCAPVNVSFFL